LLHQLPPAVIAAGEIYLELYLTEGGPDSRVGLYRAGTRVVADLTELDEFQREPWSSGCLQGIVDAPFLTLTPGTRTGIIRDSAFHDLCTALVDVEQALVHIIAEQRQAEEERASRKILNTIQKAFREALLALPAEEYDWFDIQKGSQGRAPGSKSAEPGLAADGAAEGEIVADAARVQKQFFEYAGPLFGVRVSPQSSVVPVGKTRPYRAVARDRSRHVVEHQLAFRWDIVEGGGWLHNVNAEIATFTAPPQPGLTRLRVVVSQAEKICEGEALITITDSLLPEMKQPTETQHGLPGYTFKKAPGELWRSKYDLEQNVIVINNGHRDFVYASRFKSLQLRYICRLFAKEMVFKNFPGYSPEQLLERMIELSLYTEENLK
jgi:hypothetical protein